MGDDESQKAIEELARFVAEQLNAGTPRHEIIKGLTDAGLKQSEAEQLVNHIESLRGGALNEARKQAGTKDLLWGFLFLIGGAAITLGTWAATKEGGSYWVMWGAMVFGAFYILRGLYRKVTSTTDAGTRLRWVLGSIILIGGMVGGGVAITNVMNPPQLTSPSDSFVVVDDNSFWEDEMASILSASGTVSNAHAEWSIKNVVIKIEAVDEAGKLIKAYDVSVVPSKIPPGGKGTYSARLQLPYSCTSANPSVTWEWVPP
jgi:hypothetical protein